MAMAGSARGAQEAHPGQGWHVSRLQGIKCREYAVIKLVHCGGPDHRHGPVHGLLRCGATLPAARVWWSSGVESTRRSRSACLSMKS
jgi:hypothetical protein